MNPLANILKENGSFRLNKPTLLFCLLSSTSLFSMNALALNNEQQQFIGAPMSAQIAPNVTDMINADTVDTRLILELSASEQAKLIREGKLSSSALVSAYLARIDAMDRQGPNVQSILSLNPNAQAEAKQKDADLAAGKPVGRLHGIPIVVKDNIETSELPTTAGSTALTDNNTQRDAPIIARLKAEGAIILGKTNLSQWANFRSNDSVSGWSAIGGQTRNPHSLDRTPCGSSSGSGAAMAAQFASLAIGTETNGSIICPSAMNGIVGVKPTVGLLSRTHIVPISVTQDTAGPMTRSVADAALMLSIMAGTDKADPYTSLADERKSDYTIGLDKPLKGKRIGVFTAVQGNHPAIINAFESSAKTMEALGAELVTIDKFETPEGFWGKALNVLLTEFKHELNLYLENAAPAVKTRSLADLITFNDNSKRELVIFDQSLFVRSQATTGYDDEYQENVAFLQNATRKEGIDLLLSKYKVDAIIMPSQTAAFLIDPVYGDSFAGGSAGAGWLAAVAGYPHVSVPMGTMKGLPINLSFIGKAWDEALLLNLAHQYEKETKAMVKPSFASGAYETPYFKEAMRPLK
ncbi:amidase [Brumicola nitratireducens]|uniref:Amidase n=1 Tax=Glaciecola nitratireducens (strain JCM 12485 / KCTC 12276 / FR1064) TaxID=1085623 RepID=G4QP16_GLANF|nr:amidase [Glaciecola nitratireducens]AEP31724.1 amidase [Glaciecola nitratireducens FR1064]